MQKYTIFILLFLFITTNIYSQKNRIYDNGYKDFTWGTPEQTIIALLPNDFRLDGKYKFTISDTDILSGLKYLKEEDGIKYIYKFDFLNNSLYEFMFEITSDADRNYSFIRDLRESLAEEIQNSYGKPIDAMNGQTFNNSKWGDSYLKIALVCREKNVQGTYWISNVTCSVYITLVSKEKEIRKIKDDYSKILQKRDTEKNNQRIKEFKKKY